MKRILVSLVIVFLAASTTFAQEKLNFVTVQGGVGALIGENSRAFRYANPNNSQVSKMITAQGSASIGFKFTPMVSGRIQLGVAKNNAAGEWRNSHKLQRYSFTSIRAFGDLVFNPNGKNTNMVFVPLLYAGIGVGHSTGFQMNETEYVRTHFLSTPTTSFGMHAGVIALYYFNKKLGMFVDLSLEAYGDSYDAQDSRWDPETKTKGYNPANTPLDLFPNASLGIRVDF